MTAPLSIMQDIILFLGVLSFMDPILSVKLLRAGCFVDIHYSLLIPRPETGPYRFIRMIIVIPMIND